MLDTKQLNKNVTDEKKIEVSVLSTGSLLTTIFIIVSDVISSYILSGTFLLFSNLVSYLKVSTAIFLVQNNIF